MNDVEWSGGRAGVQLQPFDYQGGLAPDETLLRAPLFRAKLEDRLAARAGADGQRRRAAVDGRAEERPVAADLDDVAGAGTLHRLGEGVELPLRHPPAAQEHERPGLGLR